MRYTQTVAILACLAALTGVGCSEKTQESASNTVDSAAQDTKVNAEHAKEAVGNTAAKIGKETEDAVQVAKLTPTVKDALVKSKIDASTINVDTSGEKDLVILRGTVKSEAERKQAAQIAHDAINKAGEKFRLKNELTVKK